MQNHTKNNIKQGKFITKEEGVDSTTPSAPPKKFVKPNYNAL